jgi:hypothetical protein
LADNRDRKTGGEQLPVMVDLQRSRSVDWKEANHMADDYDRDRDTIVVRDEGSSTGMIIAVLAIIIVLAGLWYFAMGPGAGGGTTQEGNPDVNIELPVEPVEPAPS